MTDRSDRYAARLDAHLATLASDEARIKLLKKELDSWDQRKAGFEVCITLDDYDPGELTIWDFVFPIADINSRLGRLESASAKAKLEVVS